jgi:hypothetical protein
LLEVKFAQAQANTLRVGFCTFSWQADLVRQIKCDISTESKWRLTMTRPETLFEQASYDLNKFRERRIAERRAVPRDTADRRINDNLSSDDEAAPQEKTRGAGENGE